jgi:hypothetical protein
LARALPGLFYNWSVMSTNNELSIKSRRQALALAGALTVTVVTAVGAVAGMSHGASSKPAGRVVATQVAPAATSATPAQWRDD